MFLLQQVGMIGVFISLDFLLFYVFWELVLVPMYFIIGIWGGPRKLYAAIKFFLYTLAGGVLMLLGILTLTSSTPSSSAATPSKSRELMKLSLPLGLQQWVFWAFFIGFAIKVPMFPFHTWLPDAHTEAPTAGSVILAAVLLKMGTYGFIRFSLPLLPNASADKTIVTVLAVLSLIGILYGALVSLVQQDWKKLVAYSSVSHLGFCTLGIFALNQSGLSGRSSSRSTTASPPACCSLSWASSTNAATPVKSSNSAASPMSCPTTPLSSPSPCFPAPACLC